MTGCTAGPYRVTPTAQQHRAFPDGTLADRSGTGHRRAGAFDVGSRQAPSGFVSISLFDATTQQWVVERTIDLSGTTPPCTWDAAAAVCR